MNNIHWINRPNQRVEIFDAAAGRTVAELKYETIGTIDLGPGRGSDQYVKLTRPDSDLSADQVEEWLLRQCYRNTETPGCYFCHTVHAVQVKHSSNACICTVQHRYDV